MMKKHAMIMAAAMTALALGACGAGGMASAVPESSYSAPAESSYSVSAPASAAESAEAADAEAPMEAEADMEYQAGGESYLVIDENTRKLVEEDSMLTLSLKVDTAAYTNVARYIGSAVPPPPDAVRTEEMVNYFTYDGEMTFTGDSPFSIYTEVAPSPFDAEKYMVMTRVKTKDIDKSRLPNSNLTFLIDTSGSMDSYDKLPLLKKAFSLLVDALDEEDRVSIVTYAGNAGVVLDSVSGADKERILSAIYNLESAGSTAGSEGITTAYALAAKNFMKDGNNRVILATDGDFNVGLSDVGELADFVSEKRDGGVYLSVLGFGTGNIRDDIMETLSKNGNGNYAYINTASTAKKVLVDELASNLFTVADDVKAQVEFNPARVKSYRLIGYENRRLSNEDFENDAKDAGEIGVGTDVAILFEVELEDGESGPVSGDALFEVRIRYKNPGETESRLLQKPVTFGDVAGRGSGDLRFASSVAAFGDLLRDSEYARGLTVDDILSVASESLGGDVSGYRREYIQLLEAYKNIVE